MMPTLTEKCQSFFYMNLIEGSTSGTTATIFQHVDALSRKMKFIGIQEQDWELTPMLALLHMTLLKVGCWLSMSHVAQCSSKRKGISKEYCMFCDTVIRFCQMALSGALLGQRIKEIPGPEVFLSVSKLKGQLIQTLEWIIPAPNEWNKSHVFFFFSQQLPCLPISTGFCKRKLLSFTWCIHKLAVKFTRPEKVMEHKQKFGQKQQTCERNKAEDVLTYLA